MVPGESRLGAAIDLRKAGRNREALLYAQAALRDFEAAGPGAAATPNGPASSSLGSNRSNGVNPGGSTDA